MDHHADKTKTYYPKNQILSKKIQLTGSATTLVIQKFLKKLQKGDLFPDERILHIFRAVILFDTYDFSQILKNKRWTTFDRKLYRFITNFLHRSYTNKKFEVSDTIYMDVMQMKFDIKTQLRLTVE